jgi:uncharacterized membrane protein YjfL (UPF0719 family)
MQIPLRSICTGYLGVRHQLKTMALEISVKKEPVGIFDSRLGKLYIFRLTYGGQKNLHKLVEKSLSEIDSESFVKSLIGEVCFLEKDLLDGKYRPKKPSSVKKEDIETLSSDELENFAKTYILNNEYLFKESKTKTKKNEEGDSVLYQELGDVIHPRHDDENYVDYLLRLSIIEENNQREQLAKLFKPFGAFTGFSSTLSESIKNSLRMGDTLKERMAAIRPTSYADIHPVEANFKQYDFSNIIAQQEKNRLAPFNNLAGKLDELIDSSVQVANFMVETNKIQAGIARELKDSGDNTIRFSKINIAISCLIIFLTIFSLYMSYSVSKSNNEQKIATSVATKKYVNEIVFGINNLNSSVRDDKAQAEQNTSILVNEFKNLSNYNKDQLKEFINKQNQILSEIKLMNERNTERINNIEKQLRSDRTNE